MTAIQSILYDLKTGYPDTSIVPRERLAALTTETIASGRGLQYAGEVMGAPHARAQIARLITDLYAVSSPVDMEEVMVTTGALHSIDIVCRALTSPGDIVIAESPTFFYGVTTLKMSRVQVIGVPMTPTGLDTDAVEAVIQQYGDRVKLVYTIPAYHNPTGICMSVETRRRLLELAQRYGFTILEDATYQPLYYGEPPPPILKQFDDSGCVVTVASVSKILMPALRVGWIYATPDKMPAFLNAKGDGGTSLFTSDVVSAYIDSGEFPAQIERVRRFTAPRYEAMVTALDQFAPSWLKWDAPGGGYFVWGEVPPEVSIRRLHAAALRRGVDFFPGAASYADGQDDSHMRLCFAYVEADQLRGGVALLSEIMREMRKDF